MSLANYSRFLCGEIPKRHTFTVQRMLCEGLPWVTFIKLVFPTFFFDFCMVRYLNSAGLIYLTCNTVLLFHLVNFQLPFSNCWKKVETFSSWSRWSLALVLSCGIFNFLYKVVLTFESVDEILKCDHSNESYWAVLSCGTVYYAVQGGSNFWVCGWNP